MRRLIVVAVILSLVPVFAASAFGFESWGHWSGSGERQITVVDLTPTPSWDAPVRDAAAKWSESPYVELTVVEGTPPAPGTCPWTQGVINVCAEPHPDSWSGWASQQNDGSHFVAARAWFNTRIYAEGVTTYSGRRHLACHELGHDLGLSYHARKNSGSCLAYQSLVPNATDYANLAALYSHSP